MKDHITDEEKFENSHTSQVGPVSPSTKKGTHPTNPINPLLKGSHIVSSSSVGVEPSGVSGSITPLVQTKPSSEGKKERDRINNLVQKEKNLETSGVTRQKYMARIAEALDAVIEYEVRGVDGVAVMRTRPDVARNQWGVEQAAKLFGDMIERKEIEHDLGDKTLDRFKSLSVAELKARAADLLLGKPVSRLGPVVDI